MAVNEIFYFNKEEPNRGALLSMRQIILNFDQGISETTKYGIPCFLYGKKILCYLMVDKKSDLPYFLIADGNKIDHPRLESGNRKRMKVFIVDPQNDLPINEINEVLAMAIQHHKLQIK